MLAEGKDLPTPEALCSLKLPDWLKPNGHGICCLKMFPAFYRMTMGRPLRPSSPHWMTWGIMSNGLCLTQNILEFPNQGNGCSLSAILIPDAPEKILPVFGDGGKALIQVLGGSQGHRVYDPEGVACTQTAGGGGLGVKTGLYLIPPAAPFVDLSAGAPHRTDKARCLTARYGQTTLSTHPRERSGVLYIKEATKKGWKAAYPGDTVDLGYAGSNTRRGRVGHDIAHTLETSSIQGIVERGGRIRRLMPRECFRLQGFEDEQIDKILAITSDAQAYKQAGNGVTVNVVEAIGRRIRAVDEQLRKEDAAA